MLTNVDLSYTKAIDKKMRDHVEALQDRMQIVHISRSKKDIADYVTWLASNTPLLQKHGVNLSKEALHEVLDFFNEHIDYLETVSIRRLLSIATDRQTMPERWRQLQGVPDHDPQKLRIMMAKARKNSVWNKDDAIKPTQTDFQTKQEKREALLKKLKERKSDPEEDRCVDDLRGVLPSDIRYTPRPLAKLIIDHFRPTGVVLDPARGDGAFYDQFPEDCEKYWCEIREVDGRPSQDFFDWTDPVDWAITNGPWSGSAHTRFQRRGLVIARNLVLLVPGLMGMSTYRRLKDARETGHGLKEIVILDWPEGWPQYGHILTAMHWQKGYSGPHYTTDLSTRTGLQSAA